MHFNYFNYKNYFKPSNKDKPKNLEKDYELIKEFNGSGPKIFIYKKNNPIDSSAVDISQHPNLVTSEFHF